MASPSSPRPRARLATAGLVTARASAFVLFGACSLLLSATVFAPLLLAPLPRRQVHRCSRQVLSLGLRMLLRYIVLVHLTAPHSVRGREHLRRGGQLLASTHPSLIDVVFLIALAPQANCIVKRQLWRNPFTAIPVRALGYLRNDDPDLLERCAAALRAGESLIIFPEGTRTRAGQPLKLQRGAANIALAAGCDLTPVIIHCEPRVGQKAQKWYELPPRLPQFTIEGFPALDRSALIDPAQPRSVQARRLTRALLHFFDARYPTGAT
jgi:1-acyl-sn-glycerol-3-phosphate acyltransferase